MSVSFNLEFLRKEAKTLLKLCRSGDLAALNRLGAQLPRLNTRGEVKLADVQHALARELGFSNWAALKRHDDPVERFLIAVRGGALKDSRRELAALPEMAEESIHAACAIGDPDAVANHLDIDPRATTAEHNGWPPLLYACASPLNRATARQSAGILECVKLLIDRGADPNTFVLTDRSNPESKLGAVNRAMMSANMPVLAFLIQRGATMNAGKFASNIERQQPAMFEAFRDYFQTSEVREMMPKRIAELREQGKLWGSDKWWFHARPELPAFSISIHRALFEKGIDPNRPVGEGFTIFHNVVRNGTVEMIELYLQHGADINRPTADGRTPLAVAVRAGRNLAADALRAHGASETGLRPVDELLGACVRVDEADVKSIITRTPDAAQEASSEDFDVLVHAAGMNIVAQVRIMAKCGFDLGGFSENGLAALHAAAWHGRPEIVRWLLGFHAPVNVRDLTYGSSPLAWAAHGSRNCRNDDDAYEEIVRVLRGAGADHQSAVSRSGVRPETLATDRVAASLMNPL